jgi:hypothetical protein
MFLRPRRWGKSTFLQTLADYYDKTKADAFNDTFGQLYIGKKPTRYRSSLLVLLFDFSTISTLDTLQETRREFNDTINLALEGFLTNSAKFLGNPDKVTLIKESGAQSLRRVLVSALPVNWTFY